MLRLNKRGRSLLRREVNEELSCPGSGSAWPLVHDEAGDDDAVEHHVIAAGRELQEPVGQRSSSLVRF
jgi:hypothetical protein